MINMVVPHKATGPGCVTVLHAVDQRWTTVDDKLKRVAPQLTKLISQDGTEPYDRAQLFRPSAWQLDCVEDLLELLAILEPQVDACVIRAGLKPEFAELAAVLRRLHDRPGVAGRFAEVPRSWVMIDLENIPRPGGVDPTDPVMVGGVLRRHLPPPFQVARCVVQLSSQAGIKRDQLRAHLWFWLDRPLSRAALDRWLGNVPRLDPSTFRCVQIHYTAQPIFADGAEDPCNDGRLELLPGYAEVAVPDLPDPERPRPVFSPMVGNGHRHGGAEAYANACLRNLALAPEGRRHNACVGVACSLFEITHAGLLDPERVGAQILGVMHGKGMERSEVVSILEWAWRQTKPKGLPHGR